MTHLTALANQYETDKGTVVRAGHGYSLLYDLILGPRRRDPLNLLEIGLCAADDKAEMPSVSMWRAYFPQGPGLLGRLRSELEGPDAAHRRSCIKLAVIRKKAA